jgi:hypothetical protein
LHLTAVRLLSFFLRLFCFELFPVAYLTSVVAMTWLLVTPEGAQTHKVLVLIIDITEVGNLVLSLLINVIATSTMATKTWCVRVIFKLDHMLTCTLVAHTRAC